MIWRSPSTSTASLISDETHSLRSGSWLSKCPSPSQRQVAFPVRVKLSNEQDFTTISSSSPIQRTPLESVCSQVFAEESCRKDTKNKANKIIPLAGHASSVRKFGSELNLGIQTGWYQSPPTSHATHRLVVRASPPPPPTEKLESNKYTLFRLEHTYAFVGKKVQQRLTFVKALRLCDLCKGGPWSLILF